MKRLASLIFFFAAFSPLVAENLYCDCSTGFSALSSGAESSGCLVVDNRKGKNEVEELRSYAVHGGNFNFDLRLKGGREKTASSGSFGVKLVAGDVSYKLELQVVQTHPYDELLDHRYLVAALALKKNDVRVQIFWDRHLSEGVNTDGGFNTVRLMKEGDSLSVAIGEKKPIRLAVVGIKADIDSCRIGYFCSEGSRIEINRVHFRSTPDPVKQCLTAWTGDSLDRYLAQSKDENEGYWHYLDRRMDENLMKSGGKYRLAVVRSGAGYELLYAGGAEMYPRYWQVGMRKGILETSPFVGTYDMQWHLSDKTLVEDEAYATFSGSILTLHFPLHKSEVRFHKVQSLQQ